MKGLMEKDIRLILQKKKYYLILMCCAVFISFAMDSLFIISYLTMIGLLLALSTVSLDEADNGLSFIMTMPVSRRDYAVEKHLFGYLTLIVALVIGIILQFVTGIVQKQDLQLNDTVSAAVLYLGIFAVILSIMIPIEIHFGIEKSRIAMFVIFGVCFAIGILGGKIAAALNIDLTPAIATIKSISTPVLIACGAGAGIVIIVLSILITIRIMNKKEF